ncbi:hypothetical protein [Variovorax saccharolyticus]|uniref:hypothetical protein n=1 Tax=Variovorax saccharolyticus TaxID=3053516 RepID=UPI002578DE21|nr:hypothetical protein [Variovorax sp. J31P216]MDM0030415.1 hypothetical protein [Variovorax sp. J31P216]
MTKLPDGESGLSKALQAGHANALTLFGQILSSQTLRDEDKVEVLKCIQKDGKSGFEFRMNGALNPFDKALTMEAYLGMVEHANIQDSFQRKLMAQAVEKSMAWFSIGAASFFQSAQYKKLNKRYPTLGAKYLACIKELKLPITRAK